MKACLFFLSFIFSISFAFAANKVELSEHYEPKLGPQGGDLYLPVPLQKTEYQTVLSEKFEGNADSVQHETVKMSSAPDTYIEVLHAHWKKGDKAQLKVIRTIEISDRKEDVNPAPYDDYFLKPSEHVQTDGIVAKTARKITHGLQGEDKKALAIYNWIVDHTLRDPATRGCGLGDVKTLLESGNLKGKCADLNSLFVGLARASGIAAREVWGLRVAPGQWQKILGAGSSDVTKAQHCRAEYYSHAKRGWVAVDPADIQKLILDGKMEATDPDVLRMRKVLFGSWEGNWIAFNSGRDFYLYDKKNKINYLMYPQLVSNSYKPDGMDPLEVQYHFVSKWVQ